MTDSYEINAAVEKTMLSRVSTLLFNLILHKVIGGIENRGSIFIKSHQFFDYANDIVILARNLEVLKEKSRWSCQKMYEQWD